MVNLDWEMEFDRDTVYATEREELIKQEFYSSQNRKVAKITYKKDENRHNTNTLPRVNEESI